MAESDAEGGYDGLIAAHNRKHKKAGGFQAMGLDSSIFKGILKKGYRMPTPIQRKTIPLILTGQDVVAMARTGSGKTAAFLLPMLQKLKAHKSVTTARALLVSPTRELALQTFKFLKELGKFTGLRAAVLVGGDSLDEQFAALHEHPDIIIATPGRLLHVVVEMELKLKSIEYVVFDEADRLFEMGFEEQLLDILRRLPDSRQTLLFSATLPRNLIDFAKAGLKQPALVRLDVDSKISEQLQMSFLYCRGADKVAILLHLLNEVIDKSEQVIVFCATKHHVEYLKEILDQNSISCTYLYSAVDAEARKLNIAKFRTKHARILIVTDLAARGVDIPLLNVALNFHFPPKAKLFVHRVGRVARAGRSGTALSLVSPDELPYLFDLYLFLGRELNLAPAGKDENDSLYSVPEFVIGDETAALQALHEKNDIAQLKQCGENAYKHYLQSRPAASNESTRRSKTKDLVAQLSCYPLFKDIRVNVEPSRTSIIEGLRNYKPLVTVFEMNANIKKESCAVMKAKRKAHQKYIRANVAVPLEAASAAPSRGLLPEATESELKASFATHIANPKFRELKKRGRKNEERKSEFYINYHPSNYHGEHGLSVDKTTSFDAVSKQMVVDFTMDDTDVMKRNERRTKWDRKRKRFVTDSEVAAKKIRTESGVLIPASFKSGRYNEWKTKHRIPNKDFDEDTQGKKDRPARGNIRTRTGRQHMRSELKPVEQIAKQREQQQKRRDFQNERRQLHRKKAGSKRR